MIPRKGDIFLKRSICTHRISLPCLLFLAVAAMAQTDTGSIGGFVTDPTGKVIPGARVKITNEGTNAAVNLSTDGAGYYNAPALPPGMYAMSAEAPGFKRFES